MTVGVDEARELRRSRAITRAREARRVELAPIRSEVADAISAVGWRRARPVIAAALDPVPVSGPHGAWWSKVGKRSARVILAGLSALPAEPVQGRLPLTAPHEAS
ncbi:MAG: hypothetical protein ACYCTE_03880 [Acidimicrobiales bacterium]